MNRFCFVMFALSAFGLFSKRLEAQVVTHNSSFGLMVELPNGQNNQMDIWIHNYTTYMFINGKFYSKPGALQSSSKLVYIEGGDQNDDIKIYGTGEVMDLFVHLNNGNDSLDCLINRPLYCTGGPGNDTIFGSEQPDGIYGGDDDDIIDGRGGDDGLGGDDGKDTIYGGPGKDHIRGGFGKDILFGGPGDDELNGGAKGDLGLYFDNPDWYGWSTTLPDYEQDDIIGGSGADTCVRDIYYWSDYIIYRYWGHFIIFPWHNAYQIVIDSDHLADYTPWEGDQYQDHVVPKLPSFGFYGAPAIIFP